MTNTVMRAIVSIPRHGIYIWVMGEEISRMARCSECGNATVSIQPGQRKPRRYQQSASGGGGIGRYPGRGRILRLG